MFAPSTVVESSEKNGSLGKEEVLQDYYLAHVSRQVSLVARKEVFMGKGKFAILGDGKELPQLALAKVFRAGDFRAGYYRDQTWMLATQMATVSQLFAQIYAHADEHHEPSSASRMMNSHFSTRFLDSKGEWLNLAERPNSSADVSPTACQMSKLVGLGLASKLFREHPELARQFPHLTRNGQEIVFASIGNGSVAEGIFFESLNACGVLRVPVIVSIWDDDYGISVHNQDQVAKQDITELLEGFRYNAKGEGFQIFKVKGWDYPELIHTYQQAELWCRYKGIPVIVHVCELTQPLGHSTSGSHERYKSAERLAWEAEHDCIKKMKEWILAEKIASEAELLQIEQRAYSFVQEQRNNAWKAFTDDVMSDQRKAIEILEMLIQKTEHYQDLAELRDELNSVIFPGRRHAVAVMKKAVRLLRNQPSFVKKELYEWIKNAHQVHHNKYNSFLYSQSSQSALNVPEIKPIYHKDSPIVDGRLILNACFDAAFQREPLLLAFGEDVGKIGDVNKGMEGLQAKYGEWRISDTGIREATIIGQGLGLAMRGFRPIAEIQYLDYILYALQTLSDDVATLHYRTKGGQKAPLIVRTRGHRLEGMWHAGSLMSGLIGFLQGMYLCVPRNMTQAAGFYNTLLRADEPAIVIECLNGYRLKERMPQNIGDFTVPLGIPEILRRGTDVTVVTYGSMCRIVLDAVDELAKCDIHCEVIDVQTLIPFDRFHIIAESIKKTNRVIFADEDIPGGATAYMMQKVLEEQDAFRWLDSKPLCITAQAHRPAYASDGDYFSKPNPESVFEAIYDFMHETNPIKWKPLYDYSSFR
ncbi:MAG: thiamine pyrophosphate-dependent enzyme [Cytophagales bacterium]|nr:thiamine pyrophosphate-dependent enzyme [Cytophagales bacterium]